MPTYPHVIGKPDLPGNNYIDLTDSDSSKVTNSNSNRKVSVTNTAEESDVDIISDPVILMKGLTFQKNTLGKQGLRSENILKHTSNLLYLLLWTPYTLRKYHGMLMVIRSI